MDTKQQIAETYIEHLAKEGFRPEIDKDGDVRFKVEGGIYYVIVDEKDPTYFCLIYPSFFPFDEGERRSRIQEACNFSNLKSKAVKISAFTNAPNVVASVEMFMGDRDAYKPIFERAISSIQNGVKNFVERLAEVEAPAKAT